LKDCATSIPPRSRVRRRSGACRARCRRSST
jgi:hypothetical protein